MIQIVIIDAEGFIIDTKTLSETRPERLAQLTQEAMESTLVKEVRIRKGHA